VPNLIIAMCGNAVEPAPKQGLLRMLFNRRNVVGLALGALPAAALGLPTSVAVVSFFGVRYVYGKV